MNITRMQEALAELADELAHAEQLIEDQAQRIEALEAEVVRLTRVLGATATAA
jgi:cell division protein FtsL